MRYAFALSQKGLSLLWIILAQIGSACDAIVRIVASLDNTNITQLEGGSIRYGVPDAQTSLTGLMAGQFVELDVHLIDNGCYIKADRPIEVCSYITSPEYHPGWGLLGGPAQCWIPAIEQSVAKILTSPDLNSSEGIFMLDHNTLLVTPTSTKNNTNVSVTPHCSRPLRISLKF